MKTLAVLLAIAFSITTIWRYSAVGGDFSQDLFAARQLRTGGDIFAGLNYHPPLNAYLALPFSLVEERTATLIFNLLGLIAVVLTCMLVAGSLQVTWGWAIIVATLLSLETQAAFALATTSPFVALLILLCWRESKAGRAGKAGFWWALAVLLKVYPAYLGLYFLLGETRKRFFATASAVFLLFGALSILHPGDDIRIYLFSVTRENCRRFTDFHSNISLFGVTSRIFGPAGVWTAPVYPVAGAALAISVTLSLMLAIATLLRYRTAPKEGRDQIFAALLIAMFLSSPLAWGHYLLWMTLSFALLAKDYIREERVGLLLTMVVGYACLTIFPSFTEWLNVPAGIPQELLRAVPTVGLLMLFGLHLSLAGKRHSLSD